MGTYLTTRPVFTLHPDRRTIDVPISPSLTVQLRRFEPTDLEHVHRLRTQEAVMVNTSTGKVDADLAASQTWMERYLPPNDTTTFDLMVWAKPSDGPWENIGVLGCHMFDPVPHIGYMLRTEWWGKSIATKALQAFLKVWWGLERKTVEVRVEDAEDEHERHLIGLEMNQARVRTDVKTGQRIVPEILLAEIEENNIGSKKVIQRCGFDLVGQESVVDDAGAAVLLDYIVSRPSSES